MNVFLITINVEFYTEFIMVLDIFDFKAFINIK